MIPVRQYNTICQEFVNTIDGLDSFHLVAQDNHAINKLTNQKGITLVAVIPSAEREGKPGLSIDTNAAMFFVITKYNPPNTRVTELDLFEATQQIIQKIRDSIIDQQQDGCSVFFRLKDASIHIDPEFNIFGGFLGWSMSFVF